MRTVLAFDRLRAERVETERVDRPDEAVAAILLIAFGLLSGVGIARQSRDRDMSIEVANATVGLVLLVAATTVAWYLKRRMEDASGIEVVGWAMTLMLAYILQLVGIVVLLVGILK